MLRIHLTNFRSHSGPVVFSFPEGKISLLKGKSGVGKSTVFAALTWALYGGHTGVLPFGAAPSTKVCVRIEFPDGMVVERRKRPDTLSLKQDSRDYANQDAQALIDQIFGPKIVWMSTTYLQQGERHPLMAGSSAERLEILRLLSFNTDDPTLFLDKLEAIVREKNAHLANKAELVESLTKYRDQISGQLRHTSREKVESCISTLKLERDNLHKKATSLQSLLTNGILHREKKNSILQRLGHIEDKLAKLDPISEEEVEELEAALSQFTTFERDIAPLLSEKARILNKLETLTPLLSNPEDFEDVLSEHLAEASAVERLRNTHQSRAKALGIGYTDKDIQEEISRIKKQIDKIQQYQTQAASISTLRSTLQQKLQIWEQRQAIQKKITSFHIIGEEDVVPLCEELAVIREKLHHADSQALTCPSCSSSLRMEGGKLHLSDKKPIAASVYNALKSRYEEITRTLEQREKSLRQVEVLKAQLDALPLIEEKPILPLLPIAPPGKVEDLTQRLDALNRIEIIDELDMSVSDMTRLQEWQHLRKALSSLEKKIPLDVSRPRDPRPRLQAISRTRIQRESLLEQLAQVRGEMDRISQLQEPDLIQVQEEIDNVNLRLSIIAKELEDLSGELQSHTQAEELEREYQKHKSDADRISFDLSRHRQLLDIAKKVEAETLDSVVSAINLHLEEFCSLMFTEPIVVRLSLFKALKAPAKKGQEIRKPGVNLTLVYRGIEYDGVSSLSGGEADRISLALLLALARVANSKFLFVDEVLSALDGDLRETCVEVLRLDLPRTIITVLHESVEGWYDHIVEQH